MATGTCRAHTQQAWFFKFDVEVLLGWQPVPVGRTHNKLGFSSLSDTNNHQDAATH